MGRPTMADVAKIAGVNAATVSRALAGSELVTAETRAKVKAAAAEVGYVHNGPLAQRDQRERQVLITLKDIANPFFSDVVSAIAEVAQEAGFGVLIGNTFARPDIEKRVATNFLSGTVDGLIIQTGHVPRELAKSPDFARRAVAVSLPIAKSGLTTIGIDEFAAAKEAVAFLVSLGHRDIAHIAGPPAPTNEDRLRGYRSALADAGLTVEESRIAFGDNTIRSGQEAAMVILSRLPAPTAIFCANDEMAIGAITVCKQKGLRVPEDVSIIGFDDVEIAGYYDPSLTTVRQPRRELGRRAMIELLALLDGTQRETGERITLGHTLVVRNSTARIEG
jgi:LacI family repressor for deo operon, udp, cdd, tsx, nupC, and nupG